MVDFWFVFFLGGFRINTFGCVNPGLMNPLGFKKSAWESMGLDPERLWCWIILCSKPC